MNVVAWVGGWGLSGLGCFPHARRVLGAPAAWHGRRERLGPGWLVAQRYAPQGATPLAQGKAATQEALLFFISPTRPPGGGEQQPQQQQRKQLRSARARRRGGRSPALRAGAGAEQADCGESERAVSGQGVWRGAQRPTQRPVSTCLCPALLQEITQQQTEPGAG